MSSPVRPRPALALTIGLAGLPPVVAAASLLGRRWYASSDHALELLRIADVGGGHTPLVGAGSRWGWAHPGPALFWLLAPFERLLGQTGVLAGMAAINLAAVVVAVWVAHRRGGLRVAVPVALVVAVLLRAMGLELLLDPWNPWAAFLPFVAFLLLVWAVTGGELRLLPAAVVAGSFCVQCHVGYVPLVGGLLVLAVVWELRRAGRAALGPLAVAGAVGLVVWLPPIIQQLTGHPGNLTAIADYVRHPGEQAAGWADAFGVFGRQLRPIGPWTGAGEETARGLAATGTVWPASATVVLVALAALVAHRRGRADAARLGLVALAATAIAVAATARVTGLFVPYVIRWWWGVAALSSLAILVTAIELLEPWWRRSVAVARAVALLPVAAVTAATLSDLPAPVPYPAVSRALEELRGPTAEALDPSARYLVRGVDTSSFGAAVFGLHVQLERLGVDVFTDRVEDVDLSHGDWRAASPAEVDGIVVIVDLPDRDAGRWVPPPGSRLLAEWDPLTPARRSRAEALEASIRSALGEDAPSSRIWLGEPYDRERAVVAGAPREEVDELHRLQERGDGYAVYLTPAS